jgi:site-specific DNA recombinase
MWGRHLRPILHRVVVADGVVRVRISPAGLRSVLGLAIVRENPPAEPEEEVEDTYDLEISARIATRGVRVKLVISNDDGRARREQDIVLIKTIALAHDWFHRLRTGQAPSVHDIAKAESVDRSHVSRVLRLAFLAPDIVEAIVDGRHPVELTAKRLLLREDLPLHWREQRQRLGFIPDRA